MKLRFITYNIRKGKGADGRSRVPMAALGEALAGHTPDVLLCQEVFHCNHGGDEQSAELGRALSLDPYYGGNKFRDVGHHGNSTLTSRRVAHVENHDISTNTVERRGALYVKLELEGAPLHIFNVHLGLNRWQRRKQIDGIAHTVSRVAARDEAVVLAGDFNDWRGQLDRVIVDELGFDNAFANGAGPPPPTWHARRPVLTLDRIYTRNLRATRTQRLHGAPWSSLSDHLPLVADLQHT